MIENIDEIKQIAITGDCSAQILMGFLGEYGLLVDQDEISPDKWYELAANQGERLGQFLLAKYLIRQGDKDKGTSYLRKAAESGYAPAETLLGAIWLRTGKHDEALRSFESAIDKKYLPAYVKLARMYRDGTGVAQDHSKAEEILRRGADLGASSCAETLARLLLSDHSSEDQISEGVKLMKIAARDGSSTAFLALGMIYSFGQYGVSPDRDLSKLFDMLAKEYLRKSF